MRVFSLPELEMGASSSQRALATARSARQLAISSMAVVVSATFL